MDFSKDLKPLKPGEREYALTRMLSPTELIIVRVLADNERGLSKTEIRTAIINDVTSLAFDLLSEEKTSKNYLGIEFWKTGLFSRVLGKRYPDIQEEEIKKFTKEINKMRARKDLTSFAKSEVGASLIAEMHFVSIPGYATIEREVFELEASGLVSVRKLKKSKKSFIAYLPKDVNDWFKEAEKKK